MKTNVYKLSDLGSVLTGNTPPKKDVSNYSSKDVNFIKPDDINSDQVNLLKKTTKNYLSFTGAEKARLVPANTVLVTCIGIIGKVALTTEKVAFNQQINAIIPDESIVRSKFLAYKLWSERKKLKDIANKAVVPIINKRTFSDYLIDIPNIEEQKKMEDILDIAQLIINKRKKQITALSNLKQSIFYDMFGDPQLNNKKWKLCKIGDLTKKTQYGSSKKASLTDGEFAMLRMNNITYKGDVVLDELKYVNLDEKEKEKHLVHKGELLFNRTNSKELVGKTAVYDHNEPIAYAGYLIKLIPNELANSYFISGYLNSNYGKRYLYNLAKNIVGMANINAKELRGIPIYMPPKKLQDEYEYKIKKINKSIDLFKQGQTELEMLYGSLMQKAFKGELFN